MSREIFILGGGTVQHVRPHLALSAPAYGATAKMLYDIVLTDFHEYAKDTTLGLTAMARDSKPCAIIGETNEQVKSWIQSVVFGNDQAPIVFLNVAFCDFKGIVHPNDPSAFHGKQGRRLKTKDGNVSMFLEPTEKIVSDIRKYDKDIFLVAWKTTSSAAKEEMFEAGASFLKKNHCNLVVVNDVNTKKRMIVTPELAIYGWELEGNQLGFYQQLMKMTLARAGGTFHATTIAPGKLKPITEAPETFQKVLSACIDAGAYQPFEDKTVGHFGWRDQSGSANQLWSSRRKKNYNKPGDTDLIKVTAVSKSETIAESDSGDKPSAGVRSQLAVMQKLPRDIDCIIHFHCPLLENAKHLIPIRSQFAFECGSMECGINTATGMEEIIPGIHAVMLDKHGPNICFSSKANPDDVMNFILSNFNLSERTS